jgi:putative ABC transport system permease protein
LKLERFSFNTKFQIREQVRSISRTAFLLFGMIVATILLLYGLTLQSSLDYMLNEGITELYNLKYEYVYRELQSGASSGWYRAVQRLLCHASAVIRSTNFAWSARCQRTTRLRLKDVSGEPAGSGPGDHHQNAGRQAARGHRR